MVLNAISGGAHVTAENAPTWAHVESAGSTANRHAECLRRRHDRLAAVRSGRGSSADTPPRRRAPPKPTDRTRSEAPHAGHTHPGGVRGQGRAKHQSAARASLLAAVGRRGSAISLGSALSSGRGGAGSEWSRRRTRRPAPAILLALAASRHWGGAPRWSLRPLGRSVDGQRREQEERSGPGKLAEEAAEP